MQEHRVWSRNMHACSVFSCFTASLTVRHMGMLFMFYEKNISNMQSSQICRPTPRVLWSSCCREHIEKINRGLWYLSSRWYGKTCWYENDFSDQIRVRRNQILKWSRATDPSTNATPTHHHFFSDHFEKPLRKCAHQWKRPIYILWSIFSDSSSFALTTFPAAVVRCGVWVCRTETVCHVT